MFLRYLLHHSGRTDNVQVTDRCFEMWILTVVTIKITFWGLIPCRLVGNEAVPVCAVTDCGQLRYSCTHFLIRL
jgi:hypothetical protein